MTRPILYSFRRCPYAMRARLAIQSAGITCELREIVLRDKAVEFLETSPKGTVPVLVAGDRVIEESFDIMLWTLGQNDPEGWLDMPGHGFDLIAENDGTFKTALDRYKYHTRYANADRAEEQHKAALFLHQLEKMLQTQPFLFGDKPRLADRAIITFVRQFANTDRIWFDAQPWPHLIRWLDDFTSGAVFAAIMQKYPRWQQGDASVLFP